MTTSSLEEEGSRHRANIDTVRTSYNTCVQETASLKQAISEKTAENHYNAILARQAWKRSQQCYQLVGQSNTMLNPFLLLVLNLPSHSSQQGLCVIWPIHHHSLKQMIPKLILSASCIQGGAIDVHVLHIPCRYLERYETKLVPNCPNENRSITISKEMTTFAIITIVLIVVTIIYVRICSTNFNKGLKPYVTKSKTESNEEEIRSASSMPATYIDQSYRQSQQVERTDPYAKQGRVAPARMEID